ncbi:Sodium channel protein Nach [Operophtera brumata]|uniref:Sodium channel protein Nach n=1 Tax=Operophtera brumata TaxID=104452 RepID=A0A0L7L3W0_OPEBR|nr:Sodium channel protein Nach [Operophtera brumata]
MGIIQESIKVVSKEYCAELLWVLILIVGLGCSVSLVWMTFLKYYRAPLVTTQMPEGVSVSKIIFPAVGICSNNRISKRAVTELAKRLLKEERNKHYSEEEMMSLLFGLGQLYDLQPMQAENIVQPLKLHQALGDYRVHNLLRSLQFSDAYDFPDAPSGSFAMQIISPGVQMAVMVSATFTEASRDIQHVSLELRKCRFYDESTYLPFYTYSDCILKCRMFFLLENCNCTPFNMLKMDNIRTCDMRDVPCLRIFYVRPNVNPIPPELELELVGGGVDCPMCCPTCSKTAYNYDFNNVNIYPEYLNGVPDEDREDWL